MEKIPVVQDATPPFSGDGKFHVKLIEGRFQNIRRLISWPLILMFFAFVWLQIDGQPWLLFSFEKRTIFLFTVPLSWHDLPLLSGLMISGVGLLFFMAVGWGRVWCGFACPQSIWTWIFIRIEDFTEGRVNERAKYDQDGLTFKRLIKRITKHLLWLAVASLTAITFTGYFIPIREMVADIVSLQLPLSTLGWLACMAGLTYLNAGLVREKICLHACPYSRFQGVMFDRNTKTVSYDVARGEPRANRRNSNENSGDCVDCDLCVHVCPTGIDIRDGLQAACIDCGACIDACDQVMTKLNRPKSLIRFASEAELTGHSETKFRPRLIGYAVVTYVAFSAVIYGFMDTTQLLVEIRRDRHMLFTQMDDNVVCNNYLVKVEGFASSTETVGLDVKGKGDFALFGPGLIDLKQNNASWLPYRVCAANVDEARTSLEFIFSSNGQLISKKTTFLTKVI